MPSQPSTSTQVNLAELIAYNLREIRDRAQADLVCACSYHPEQETMEVAGHEVSAGFTLDAAIEQHLREIIRQLPPSGEPRLIETGTRLLSGLVFPLSLPDDMIGVVALFSGEANAFTLDQASDLLLPVNMIRTCLENQFLYEALSQNMMVSTSIRMTAQTLIDDPVPQSIVDILCENLFDAHVTSCALLFYGPLREDRPFGPFEYLEMRGSWSKQRGQAVALGTRIYLKFAPEFMEQLDQRDPLVYTELSAFKRMIDPFSRSLLRGERVASLTILPLHAGRRKLGLLLIGTNKPHHFTRREVQNYQDVAEFLAVSAMSQVLQQHNDLVRQGRYALLEAVKDAVLMVLPDASGPRVLTVNQRFSRYFDLGAEDAQGLLLRDLLRRMTIPEDVRDQLGREWLSIQLRDPATQHGEFHYIQPSGVHTDIEWYSAPVYQNQNIMGRIYTFYDITAERTARRLRSTFLSRVSHELRTPLTSIQGFAEFILEVSGDELPDLAREYTEIILKSARHLRSLFSEMIDMSRADMGELPLVVGYVHLPDVIIDVVAQLELQYKQRDQQIIMELDDDLPPVLGDADRLMQVLNNLITNAIKYSPPGGHIIIRTDYITSRDMLPQAYTAMGLPAVQVAVMDEGEGLNEDDVEQVVMPFFRTQRARQQQIEGVGLGLAVARSIIELHRGQFWAEPATPEHPGGRFLFALPVVLNSVR